MGFDLSRPSRKFAVLMIAALLAGYAISGRFLYRTAIGLDPSGFPAGEWLQRTFGTEFSIAIGGAVLGLVALLLIAMSAAIYAAYGVGPSTTGGMSRTRRRFLTGSAAGVGALVAGIAGTLGNVFFGIGKKGDGWSAQGGKIFSDEGVVKTHPVWEDAWKTARVESYGRLGRTDWAVSDTVLGTGRLRGSEAFKIVRAALDRGVNYIDTAPDYSATGSELAVGEALRDFPRDQVFLATKFCTSIGHLPTGTSVARYKEVIHDSLRRLETDYIDLIHIHSCDEVDRLMDENVHEAFDQLKAEGKARFLGVSTHTPRLVEVANAAIDSGRFDVMMLAYHHGIWPRLAGVIDRAHDEQDMGIVAMKTLKGARH
ncbi:MAG: aldo/keto reductase, partial [Myxococcota bacterium]